MKVRPRKVPKTCDPAVCYYCQYIGEGDFICDKYITDPDKVLVIDEWEPTDNYLQCQRGISK